MEVTQIDLENIGRFRSLRITLATHAKSGSNVTVFIGNNGAGKTSILKALATSLSWFVARLRSENAPGNPIPEEAILNGTPSAAISLTVRDKHEFHWTISKTRKGRVAAEHSSQLQGATSLADEYRRRLTENAAINLPLIAYYPVERSVLTASLKTREKYSFQQLDGYDKSLSKGVDFQRFFDWFREREDIEHEKRHPGTALKAMDSDPEKFAQLLDWTQNGAKRVDHIKQFDWEALNDEVKKIREVWGFLQRVEASAKDSQLQAVRAAIQNFMPGFSDLRVQREPQPHMTVQKNGETLDIAQLSQGEKSLMALVGDIARRLAMMNPGLENPLSGQGIVLIDEVDLHLHPQWARTIIERLTTTFPGCQFVLCTHSPLVISDSQGVLVYSLENGELIRLPSQYGQDANTVLLEAMDTDIRNADVARRLNDLLDLIQSRKLEQAHTMLAKLEEELPANHLELSKAKLLLHKEELRLAKN